MGHRQQMTPKQRLDWDIMQYKARQEATKGHSHSYMNEKVYKQLDKQGYSQYKFSKGYKTSSEHEATIVRDELRKEGNFARIISTANKLRTRNYGVYFKGKMILDPDADGTQWLYRGNGICQQTHHNLLPYACYDWEQSGLLIGTTNNKKLAQKLIDNYIANKSTKP